MLLFLYSSLARGVFDLQAQPFFHVFHSVFHVEVVHFLKNVKYFFLDSYD